MNFNKFFRMLEALDAPKPMAKTHLKGVKIVVNNGLVRSTSDWALGIVNSHRNTYDTKSKFLKDFVLKNNETSPGLKDWALDVLNVLAQKQQETK